MVTTTSEPQTLSTGGLLRELQLDLKVGSLEIEVLKPGINEVHPFAALKVGQGYFKGHQLPNGDTTMAGALASILVRDTRIEGDGALMPAAQREIVSAGHVDAVGERESLDLSASTCLFIRSLMRCATCHRALLTTSWSLCSLLSLSPCVRRRYRGPDGPIFLHIRW